jgi:rare lipoprotein A
MEYNGLHTWILRATTILLTTSVAPSFAHEPNAASKEPIATAKEPDASLLRNTQENRNAEKVKHHEPDLTGKKRVGKASFYAKQFAGKPMADGAPMDPHGNNAASKTLPLGTTAKVTNLETGQSAVVTIRDRGPYVPGRIVDLSPATAQQIGITQRKGVAAVAVAPITVPQPNGAIKLGAAVHEALFDSPRQAEGVGPEVARLAREAEAANPTRETARLVREAGGPRRQAAGPAREPARPLRQATADAYPSTLHTR